MIHTYKTKGVCSREIIIDIDDGGIIKDISFAGGCNGNLKGMASLSKGRDAQEVIDCCTGIKCGFKSTSCPDQLSIALKEILSK